MILDDFLLLNNLDYNIVETTGNEYDAHKRAKVRIAKLMQELGFVNIEIEKPFVYHNMIVDVYGEYSVLKHTDIEKTKLAIEIDGKKGHSSKRAYHKDKSKRRNLGIRVLVLPVGNLDKKMDDYTIKSELLKAVLR